MFNSNIEIYGKHAILLKKYSRDKQGDRVTFTVTDNTGKEKEIFLFDNYLQGFMVSAMLGIYSHKMSTDDGDRSNEATIFSDILIKKKGDLDTIVQFMILTEDDNNVDKKIRDAFAIDRTNSLEIERRVISYVRGGLEVFDEWFGKCHTYEDVANQIILFNQNILGEMKV
jgi:hypothetical protein